MPCSANWSAMVLPTVLGAAASDFTPSMSINPGGQGSVTEGFGHSLVRSMAGVAASVPVPAIGHTFELEGKSVTTVPDTRFGVQLALCQSGALSLRTPKFDPPTTSR